jgi:hypothetical protein
MHEIKKEDIENDYPHEVEEIFTTINDFDNSEISNFNLLGS